MIKKLLIADDYKIVREGIRAILEQLPDYEVKESTANDRKIYELCQSGDVDVVILDVNQSGINSVETTGKVTSEFPEVKILALTDEEHAYYIRRMVDAGASGYLLKSDGKEELLEAIATILKGQFYFSSQIRINLLPANDPTSKIKNPDSLTDREIDVLKLICKEFTNQEIAQKLYVSVRTVDAHRRNLLRKSGVRNTAGLVRFALENRLI